MSWELSLSCLYLEAGKPMIGSLVVTVPLRQVMSWKTGGSSWRPIPCRRGWGGLASWAPAAPSKRRKSPVEDHASKHSIRSSIKTESIRVTCWVFFGSVHLTSRKGHESTSRAEAGHLYCASRGWSYPCQSAQSTSLWTRRKGLESFILCRWAWCNGMMLAGESSSDFSSPRFWSLKSEMFASVCNSLWDRQNDAVYIV